MNWTGWDVGPNGVRGVPRNASHLYNWGKGEGTIMIDGCFAPGEEDLVTEEFQRLRGTTRKASEMDGLGQGFSIFKPSLSKTDDEETEESLKKENERIMYIGVKMPSGTYNAF